MKKLLIGLLIGATLITGMGFAYAQTQSQEVPPTFVLLSDQGEIMAHGWVTNGVVILDTTEFQIVALPCCDTCSKVTVTSPDATSAPPNNTHTFTPIATPVPPTVVPPTEKPKCNQGVGNGNEGCDPGNSNHNQPSNDENGGSPGNPGRGNGHN